MNKIISFITKFTFSYKFKTKVKKFKSNRKIKNKRILFDVVNSWQQFFDNISLNGMFLIGGTKKTLLTRFSISVVFVICLSLGFYLCEKNLKEYEEMSVRTTIRYDTKPEIGFPAISICPAQLGRKSSFGTSNVTLTYLSLAFSRTEEEQKLFMTTVSVQ